MTKALFLLIVMRNLRTRYKKGSTMVFIPGREYEPENQVRRECMNAVVSGQKASLTQDDLTRMSQECSRDDKKKIDTAFERHAFGYDESIDIIERRFFYEFKEEVQYGRYSDAVRRYSQAVDRWNAFMELLHEDVNAGADGELNLSKKQLLALTNMLDKVDMRNSVRDSVRRRRVRF